jgi:D-alanyl-D-alanine dipeptidase
VTYRKRRLRAIVLLVVFGAIAADLGHEALSSPAPPVAVHRVHHHHHHHHPALGEAGGALPDGTTVYDDDLPGVAKLRPALLRALRRAAGAAAGDGVELVVNSGWRSAAYEDHLRREAVEKYGSEAEAARWVATGTTSPHVSGEAVDLGPAAATEWLSAHGAAYGLCRIYANEPWHFELRPAAVARGCPAMYADPTHDPRMQG